MTLPTAEEGGLRRRFGHKNVANLPHFSSKPLTIHIMYVTIKKIDTKGRIFKMKVISFFNVKGGVGKSTSAVNVGFCLADKGKKVLIIDLDPQANTTDFFDQGHYNDLTIKDVFDESCNLKDAIQKTEYDQLDIIPSTILLNRTEKLMTANISEPQQLKLASYLQTIQNDYDYIICDCSPSAEALVNINGLAVSNLVLIPMRSDKWAIQGLQYSLEIINTVRKFSPYLRSLAAFFVATERTKISKDTFQSLKSDLGDRLLDIDIPKSTVVQQSSFAKTPLVKYDASARVSKQYVTLTDKITEIMEG